MSYDFVSVNLDLSYSHSVDFASQKRLSIVFRLLTLQILKEIVCVIVIDNTANAVLIVVERNECVISPGFLENLSTVNTVNNLGYTLFRVVLILYGSAVGNKYSADKLGRSRLLSLCDVYSISFMKPKVNKNSAPHKEETFLNHNGRNELYDELFDRIAVDFFIKLCYNILRKSYIADISITGIGLRGL